MARPLDILERLIGFNSVSANSNLDIVAFIEDFLKARGFAVHRVPDSSGRKAGLFASIGPAGSGVLLSGHTDVVPTLGQHWTRDPFRMTRKGDRVVGRGTTDMKGYLACMMSAADRAANRALKEPLKLAFSYDEEIGCVGIQSMIDSLAATIGLPRACLVGEPTGMRVAIGHKGKAALEARCFGQGGHSALAPHFVNALHLAGDFLWELRDLQEWYRENGAKDAAYDVPYSTIHVGKLSGGTALNIVPDRADLTFEYRHLAADQSEEILTRVQAAAARVAGHYRARFPDARIEVDRYNAYPGLDMAQEAEVVGFAQRLAQAEGTIKVAFGTEAGVFHGLGVPTVVCGPGSMQDQGHKPDESLSLAQLAACEAMLGRLVDEIST